MVYSKFVAPQHGLVWVSRENCLGVVKNPRSFERRVELLLLSNEGFEFSNLCNFKHNGILDASPVLKKFKESVLKSSDASASVGKDTLAFCIGLAVLEAVNKVISKCSLNKRLFPWNVLCAELCMYGSMVKSSNPSPREAYFEAYRNFSVLLIRQDICGYISEIAKADDFHLNPSKYFVLADDVGESSESTESEEKDNTEVIGVATVSRAERTRHSQLSLRNHVKHDSSANEVNFVNEDAARDFVDSRPVKIPRR